MGPWGEDKEVVTLALLKPPGPDKRQHKRELGIKLEEELSQAVQVGGIEMMAWS